MSLDFSTVNDLQEVRPRELLKHSLLLRSRQKTYISEGMKNISYGMKNISYGMKKITLIPYLLEIASIR
jgi:hypothetical protein